MKYYTTATEADRVTRALQETYPEFRFRYMLSRFGHAYFIEYCGKQERTWVYTWPELMRRQYGMGA
jgi:hypothetical protein